MSKPVLYVFAISHYCEKARWALDYLNIDYELAFLAPGIHIKVAKKLGASGSSLPILLVDGRAIQGSVKIIDWADRSAATPSLALSPEAPEAHGQAREDCLALEKRLDEVAGIHTRRCFYSEALTDQPETVRPIFTKDLPIWHGIMVRWKWKLITKRMIERMDLGPEQFEDSRRILEGELDWLDGLLSDGRRFFVGERFSRADMAAASLLAPLALPKEHPTYTGLSLPPRFAAYTAGWKNRPSLLWVREIYRQYR